MRTVAVVGTSIAGWRAAQELREQGFDGRVVLIGAERHRPYDRPALSKDFLSDGLEPEELTLASEQEETALSAEWRLGTSAVRLRPRQGLVALSDGTTLATDGVVLATGSTQSTLPGHGPVSGVHYLRTLDDALALRAEIQSGARVVVVGAGLIGSEIAATCRALGARVTLRKTRSE